MSDKDAPSDASDDISFLDLLVFIAKHKRLITVFIVACAVLSAGGSLLMPNIYTGTARVLPPQQNPSTAAMLLGQVSGLAGIAGSQLGIKNPNELYVGMLKSRTIADSIIGKFALQSRYEKATMVETREALASNTSISIGKDGLITIAFEDEDPKFAADVANAFVEELDRLTQSLAVTEAAQRRLFFERQLQQARTDLTQAETALKLTQEKTGLIKLDDQGRAIIEAVAALRAQIATKEVELRAMRTFATEQNSDYVRTQQQLAGLRSELAKLERSQAAGDGDLFLPTGKVPEAGLEYIRRVRDVKYYEAIFELLAKQFEAAKIDEAKEAAILQVVDKAVPPDRKSKPARAVIVALATLLGVVTGVLWAFVREAKERATRDPALAGQLTALREHLRIRS